MAVSAYPGQIESIAPHSLAARLGLLPGDALLAVNGHGLRDVLDVQYYAAEDELVLRVRRGEREFTRRARRPEGQPLGLEFTHPTFDVDIRRCNNLCPFCFVLQTPTRMRRALYIKDDDYRYSFLYGHFVTLTNLSPEDWERIAEQRLSPLYVSVHATEPALRRQVLRNAQAPDVREQLAWLRDHGIVCHTQIVLTPAFNDGVHLDRSIEDLAAFHPAVQSVSVVPVGITKQHKYGHRPYRPEEARQIITQVETWQQRLRPRLGVRFAYLTDEWYLQTGRPVPPRAAYDGLALEENGLGMVRGFLDDWKRVRRELAVRAARGDLAELAGRRVMLATGTLFAPTLADLASDFGAAAALALDVVPVRNARMGPGITVAGLLMGEDVAAQLGARLQQWPADLVVLPRIMFDHPQGISLDDHAPGDLARALGRPVALADALGDVLDALLGQNALVFDPAAPAEVPIAAGAPTVSVAREGGWAVEKYL